jgi:hypothetical protein
VQYEPTFNGSNSWQLYHGAGYTGAATFNRSTWTRLRVVIQGSRALVFVNDTTRPVLSVSHLRHRALTGGIGVAEATIRTAPGVYFSNFRYRRLGADESIPVDTAVRAAPTLAGNTPIRRWSLSPAADADAAPQTSGLPAVARAPRGAWLDVETEPNGRLNIAEYRAPVGVRSRVAARTILRAMRDTLMLLRLGYSDDVDVYLNGRPLFTARNGWLQRSPLHQGLMTPDDGIYLPLRRGDNELIVVITEEFGGWGLMARIE